MATVNLEDWQFDLGENDSSEFIFAGHVDFLRFLANTEDHYDVIQLRVQQRLAKDPVAKAWHTQRTKLGLLPHFCKYRTKHYDHYHAAAHAVHAANATDKQLKKVQGLQNEIMASQVILPRGQVLFHGRGDLTLHESKPYPSFISTSLDPVVSANHAIKRQTQNGAAAKAYVYALTLSDDLPAIWGNGGRLCEWELLLQTKLSCSLVAIYPGQRFDVVEAEIRS